MSNCDKIYNFLIYDEIEILRIGIEKILADNFNGANIVVAKSHDEIIGLSEVLQYNLHIIGCNSIDANQFIFIRKIKKIQINSKILVLSSNADVAFMNKCLSNGAVGFITSNITEDEFVRAVSVSLKGGNFFSNDIKLQIGFNKRCKEGLLNTKVLERKLSKREFQLAQMLVNGENNSDIYRKLDLAKSTISTYKKRIFIKTDTTNLLELAEVFKYNYPIQIVKKKY